MKTYKVEDLTKAELIEHMRSQLALPSQRQLCFIMSTRIHKKARQIGEEAQKLFGLPLEKKGLATFRKAEALQEKGWAMEDEAHDLWKHAMSLPIRDD